MGIPDQRAKIQAGDLNQQVVIQTATIGAADSRGKPSVTWPNTVTSVSGNALTVTGSVFAVGQAVMLVAVAGFLPSPLADGTTYYVKQISASGEGITLSATPGGSVITLTNAGSGTMSVWGDPATGTLVRARVETLSGRKGEIAKQLCPTASHMVTMRWRQLNENTQRLVYKVGRVFNIGQANDVDEQHVRLEISCTELKPQGTP